MTELRMFEYRIYPSRIQVDRLHKQFAILKEAHNTLLEFSKKDLMTSRYDMNMLLRDMKICDPQTYSTVYSQSLQNIADRLSKAYYNFFNRIKMRKKGIKIKAGYPRFKSRITSITYPQSGFKLLSDKRLRVSKVGSIPIKLHRIPKGKIKTMTIKQNKAGQWHIIFACQIDFPKVKHPNNNKIGIDVGLEKFLTDNKGQGIANPRFYLNAEKRLSRLQRRHSRRIKGSHNREKARVILARQHLKVFNQRTDFLHKLSHTITRDYKIICGEYLNIQNMIKGNLAKHILDASWGRFYRMLSYKAVTSGGELRKNPKTRGSSHRCSKCGFYVREMPLSQRIFQCPRCRYTIHRDTNASNNHINDTDGLSEISTPMETRPPSLRFVGVSRVNETGTINGT